ncbi:MAG: sirohydrochlorin chelatase [Oscillatoriales cyanobacterium]|nr:MAG: sirohydrochlorin chelatase [Oscillatoriales cyanobacterium]
MGYPRSTSDPARPPLRAIVLVAHGSRDGRSRQSLELLANRLSAALQMDNCPVIVGVAQLECAPSPLADQLVAFAHRSRAAGAVRVEVLPLFLSLGVHASVDVPEQVAIAWRAMGDRTDDRWQVYPPLGSWPGFAHVVGAGMGAAATHQSPVPDRTWLLLAHGSRNPAGNQPIEQLADRLGMALAYWAIAPGLADQLTLLVRSGRQRLGVLPYFLFAGGLTDAIAQQIETWQQDWPSVDLVACGPIGPAPVLVQFLADRLLNTPHRP